jgi:hypothetical protein
MRLAAGLLLLVACGGGAGGADAGPPADARIVDLADFVPLIEATWSLPPGEEGYYCTSVILDRDVTIGGFVPVAPLGTHHTVVSIGEVNADGWCDVTSLGSSWLYASGVGTNQLVFPEGAGMVLTAGTRVNLQLHLFNTTDAPLTATSGVSILPVAEVRELVNVFLPGSTSFSIPPHTETSASGVCRIGFPETLLAVFPHMHQMGKHMKVELWRNGRLHTTVWDQPFTFGEQEVALVGPIELLPDDELHTTCTWDNTTDHTLRWGESSLSEMCFAITFRIGGGETSIGTFPICGG